jgi:hypothetical protein
MRGPPDDFMEFCDVTKRWTDSRRAWLAAVFRVQKAAADIHGYIPDLNQFDKKTRGLPHCGFLKPAVHTSIGQVMTELRALADDLTTFFAKAAVVFPPAAVEQGRLHLVFGALGVPVPARTPPADTNEVASHKSVLTAATGVVMRHVTGFAAVTYALVAAHHPLGLCMWAMVLESVAEGIFSTRTHLVAFESDTLVFLRVHGLRAAVAGALMDLDLWRNHDVSKKRLSRAVRTHRLSRAPESADMVPVTFWAASLADEVAYFGARAAEWWAPGDKDQCDDHNMWFCEALLSQTRAAMAAAARDGLLFAGLVFSSTAFASTPFKTAKLVEDVFRMVARIDAVAVGASSPPTGGCVDEVDKWSLPSSRKTGCYGAPVVRRSPSPPSSTDMVASEFDRFVLISDLSTGPVVETLLALFLTHHVVAEIDIHQDETVRVLAAYCAVGRPLHTDAVYCVLSEISTSVFFRERVASVFDEWTSLRPDEARMWWRCLEAPVSSHAGVEVVSRALRLWQGIVRDAFIQYIVRRIERIVVTCHGVVAYGAYDPETYNLSDRAEKKEWAQVQQEAKALVSVTGMVQEIQHAVSQALRDSRHAGDLLAMCGPPDDFVHFCDGWIRWSNPRRVWIAAVFRGGAAMRARKAAAAPPAARRSKRAKKYP